MLTILVTIMLSHICVYLWSSEKQNMQLRTLDRKRGQLEVMPRIETKDSNYYKIVEIVDQRLNDKRLLRETHSCCSVIYVVIFYKNVYLLNKDKNSTNGYILLNFKLQRCGPSLRCYPRIFRPQIPE